MLRLRRAEIGTSRIGTASGIGIAAMVSGRNAKARMGLDALLTPVLEPVRELVSHLIPDHPADADPTGLSKGLQSSGDVDAIAENVVPLGDHIAQVDPDAELNPFFRRGSRVPLGHLSLHLDRAPDGVDHTRELGKEPVAGVLHDPAPVLRDLRLDQVAEVSLEPLVRPLLILPHQARIPRHVGGEDRGEAADGGHGLSGGRLT